MAIRCVKRQGVATHNSAVTCAAPAGAHGRGGDAAAGQPLIFGQQLGRTAHHGLANPAAGGVEAISCRRT